MPRFGNVGCVHHSIDLDTAVVDVVLDQVSYSSNKYAWYLSPSILKWYRGILKKFSADQVSSDISLPRRSFKQLSMPREMQEVERDCRGTK